MKKISDSMRFPMNAETRDKVKGSIWGLLVGDALGSPLQFGPGRKERKDYLTEMVPCRVFNTPKGCWTDDGSLALCIVDSFNRCKGYDLKDIAETFWKWQEEGYLSSMPYSFDEGFTTSRNITWAHINGTLKAMPGSATNGGIMRFSPGYFIGVAYGNEMKIPLEISQLTHSAAGCDQAAWLLIDALNQAMDNDRDGMPLGGNVKEDAFGRIRCDSRDKVNPSGLAIPVLNAALWAFHKTKTFEDALVEVINLGNDSDTSGAICGQIAGAFYGYKAIPQRWLKDMKDFEKLDAMIEKFLDGLDRIGTRD